MSEEKIISDFESAQQNYIDGFKLKMKQVCDNVLGTIYSDVSCYADTDAHVNYYNYLQSKFASVVRGQVINDDYGHYSWAHGIRMDLLKNHRAELSNKIIDGLEDRIKSLESQVEQLRERRY